MSPSRRPRPESISITSSITSSLNPNELHSSTTAESSSITSLTKSWEYVEPSDTDGLVQKKDRIKEDSGEMLTEHDAITGDCHRGEMMFVSLNANPKLLELLSDVASQDPMYSGFEIVTPASELPALQKSLSQPLVFQPMEGSPTDKPMLVGIRT